MRFKKPENEAKNQMRRKQSVNLKFLFRHSPPKWEKKVVLLHLREEFYLLGNEVFDFSCCHQKQQSKRFAVRSGFTIKFSLNAFMSSKYVMMRSTKLITELGITQQYISLHKGISNMVNSSSRESRNSFVESHQSTWSADWVRTRNFVEN